MVGRSLRQISDADPSGAAPAVQQAVVGGAQALGGHQVAVLPVLRQVARRQGRGTLQWKDSGRMRSRPTSSCREQIDGRRLAYICCVSG